MPTEEVVLKPPPELPKPESQNVWLTALPALSGLGSIVYLFSIGRNPIAYVAGCLFLVSALALVGGSLLRARSGQRDAALNGSRDYVRYLERMRLQVRGAADAQRRAREWGAPPPETLWSLAESRRLWERRPSDPDFGVLRIGSGPQYLTTPLTTGETGPVEDLDPLGALALKRFISTHSVVPELPIQLALRRFAAIGVGGDRDAARALLRALVAQACTFHAPADLQVVVCTANPDAPEWEWAKWLPHAAHPTEVDHVGPLRMINSRLADLEEDLAAELSRRSRFSRTAPLDQDTPHLLVVLDGGRTLGTELVLDPDGLAAVTVLDLDGPARELVARHGLALVLDDGTVSVRGAESLEELGEPDALDRESAEALAQQLARHRLDVASARSEDLASFEQTLPTLLGIPDPAALDLPKLWTPRPTRDRLSVPVGMGAEGERLVLDIKESAQDGMGPHGLIVGATGSGKSELLRTLVLAMATTHPPEQLNIVLVDFKGGATFAGMSSLPHVAASITNLEDDLTLVDRMEEALSGELNRRQEILRDAGNLVSIREYDRARVRGAKLPPLPSLFIVVDEFSELLAQKPDFAHLFVQIGRLGRSLGLHLLLASQRVEESKMRGLEAHLSYRIGLRTFSEQESRTAIGVVDAHHLPQAPGHGLLRTDTATMRRFRSAFVSGAYRTHEGGGGDTLQGLEVRRFTAGLQPVPTEHEVTVSLRAGEVAGMSDVDDEAGVEDRDTVLSVMVSQMAGRGTAAHQVWLPPLDEPDTLDNLMPRLRVDPVRGFGVPPDTAPLQIPLGSIDRPFHQRRDPLVLDAAGSGGHIAVVGGPRSGKSTLIRSIITGLALRHTPEEVQFFGMDFGGQLFSLGELPHVSGVASRLDPDGVRRVFAEVSTILEERETRFRNMEIDSMATYRRLRAEGKVPEDRFGDVFLVVDGWAVIRQNFEELETELIALFGRSLNYGVHVLLSAGRWLDLRLGLRDLIGTKYELKLGDSLDSEIDRKTQGAIPDGRPGRGIVKGKLHYLAAIPRVDGHRRTSDVTAGLDDLVAKVRHGWPGDKAPQIRRLPGEYPLAEVPAEAKERGIVLGLEGERLEPVVTVPGQDVGLVLIGDTESGKTSFLRGIGQQVLESGDPAKAKVLVFDYRLTMLREFDGPFLLDYITGEQQAANCVAGLMQSFQQRMPRPDLSPEQLRDRSWWDGPEVHVLIDDYDLIVTPSQNPLLPLLSVLTHARNIGLNLYLTRQAGGASKAAQDPFLSRLREMNVPVAVMSAPRAEPAIFGVRSRTQPQGRGILQHRRLGIATIQAVRAEAPTADGASPGPR